MKDWLKGRKWQVGENRVFLQWREVTCGVLLRRVVCVRLFKISLNAVEKSHVRSKLTDVVLVWVVRTETDFEGFQKDFTNLRDWRIEWDKKFRANKCKAIYRKKGSPHFTSNRTD